MLIASDAPLPELPLAVPFDADVALVGAELAPERVPVEVAEEPPEEPEAPDDDAAPVGAEPKVVKSSVDANVLQFEVAAAVGS